MRTMYTEFDRVGFAVLPDAAIDGDATVSATADASAVAETSDITFLPNIVSFPLKFRIATRLTQVLPPMQAQ